MKSSKALLTLFGVIASGRRRKPVYIRQQALVSQLYPVFLSESPVSVMFEFLGGGTLYDPPNLSDALTAEFSFLSSGFIEDYDPFVRYEESHRVDFSISFLSDGFVEDYDPFVRYTHQPVETVSFGVAFNAPGAITDTALRYTQQVEDIVSPSFSFRAGGFITG